MSRRTLLVLAVTAALLGGYVLLFERAPGGGETERRVLRGLQRERVRRIRITGAPPSRRVLQLERARAGEPWRLTSPRRGRADREAVARLLALLEFLEPHRSVPGGTNRRQLGLAPPQAVITLFAAREGARPIVELEVGRLDPSGHGVYIAHAGTVHVVDRDLSEMATAATDDWRDRRLAPAWAAKQVRRIRISGRDRPSLELELKRGEARLQLEAGGWVRVDPTAGRRLLAGVAGLRASRFLRGEGGSATAEVLVEGTKGRRLELRLGAACPGRPAERQVVAGERGEKPVVCCVEREDLSLFVDASEDSLVDRRLLHLGEPDLERIVIGSRVELIRDAGRWRYRSGESADGLVVREWVEALSHLVGARVQRLRKETFAERGRVALHGGPGTAPRVLRYGAASGGELPVRRGEERAVVWIPEGQARKVLGVHRLHFRSRRIVELSHHLVRRLVTIRGGEREVLVRGDDGWELVAPVKAPVDRGHVVEVVQAASQLRATRLLEERPPAAGRVVTLELTVRREKLAPGDAGPPAEEVTRVRLSMPPGDGPCFVVGRSIGFEIAPAVCRLLARRRADPRLLRGSRSSVMNRIELSLAQRRLTLEKRGPAWHDAGSGRALDTAAVAELIRTLRGLRGEPRYDLKMAAPTLEARVRTTDDKTEGFAVDARNRSRRLSDKVVLELDGEQAARLRERVRSTLGR